MSDAQLSLGERLKAAREKRHLTVAKAADQLHLDAWVIAALESGDYARIGPAVYAKGHLRRYAAMLGLSEEQTLAGFAAASTLPDPAPTPTVSAQPDSSLRMPGNDSGGRHVALLAGAGIVIAVLAAGAVLWRVRAGHSHVPPTADAAAEAPGAPAGAAADLETPVAEPAAQPQSGAAQAPVGAAPSVGLATATQAGAAAGGAANPGLPAAVAAPADSGRVQLRLSFAAASWVDVHDAAGAHVFAGTARAHSAKTFSGAGPLKVHLGAAAGVQMEINNRAVAIAPQFIQRNTADFEAAADGVLRAAKPLPPRDTRSRG